MFSNAAKEFNLEFPAEMTALDSMRDFTSRSLSETPLSSREIQQSTLALEEATTNIIRHAYLEEKGVIRIKISVYRRRIIITLTDFGRPFFPEADTHVSLSRLIETSRKGGLGQLMIQKLMDDVQYIAAEGYNEMRMTKLLPRRFAAANPLRGRAISLRTRFSLATLAIVLLIVAGSFYMMETRIVSSITRQHHENMASLSSSASALARSYILNRRSYVEFDELAYSLSSQSAEIERVTIIDSAGIILADSEDLKLLRKPFVLPAEISAQSESILGSQPQSFEVAGKGMTFLRTSIMAGKREIGSVALVYSSGGVSVKVTEARQELWLFILAELLFGLFGIYLLSNYFVRPILTITEQVRRYSENSKVSVSELPVEGAEEFFVISNALNEMTNRLQRQNLERVERERLKQEIVMAGEIQQGLLPQDLPHIPALDVSAYYKAASHVGGDLYDVFPLDSERFCLTVADVSGKGVPASLVMSALRTVVRLTAPGLISPSEILTAVEKNLLQDIPSGIFITVGMAVYEVSTRKCSYASAGHNPLLHYDSARREIRAINPRGAPLGLSGLESTGLPGGSKFAEESFTLATDDFFLVYTDGLSDLLDGSGARLGADGLLDRLQSVAREEKAGGAEKTLGGLISRLDEFRSETAPPDDMTALVGFASAPHAG